MKKVKEFMDSCSQDIIRELGKKEFNTTDVVSTINQRKEWQKEYIKLSEQYGSYNKLNAQIGRYLANNQKKMGICKDGGKEVSISITGRRSPNQKWKILLVPLLLLFMSISTYAQTLTPQQNKKMKWGYIDETGKTVIKYKYDDARAFSDGLAAVKHKGIYGYIDKKGKVAIPLAYDGAGDFSNGLAKVKIGNQFGIVDKTGTFVIPLEYTEISKFSDRLLKAKNDTYNYWNIIDETGKEIATYTEIGEFSDGLAKVGVKYHGYWKWGYIDKTGKEIIPLEYLEVSDFSDGLAKVLKTVGYGKDRWGIIDKTGAPILPFEYGDTEINSMPLSAFIQKEKLRKQEEEKQSQLKEQRKAEILAFFDEVEAVLDNDYYSPNCHPVEVLEELKVRLEAIDSELYNNYNAREDRSDIMAARSTELQNGLNGAIAKQLWTKKFGVATAKKIEAGQYEIGMSKAVCKAIPAFIDVLSKTANTELWEVIPLKGKNAYLHFIGNKLVRISY